MKSIVFAGGKATRHYPAARAETASASLRQVNDLAPLPTLMLAEIR
jgi:hypothetical protein